MLFDRFIFVLYILSSYAWFLLGMHYHSDAKCIPLISMLLSLSCVIIISLFEIQKLFLQEKIVSSADRWSTILWSIVHIILCLLMLLDGLEYINPMLVFALAGLVLSIVVMTVMTCSCHVILRNSHSWTPHIHLTCISFWVVMQYISIRFPDAPMEWMTTPPIVCMTIIRVFEWSQDRYMDIFEAILWILCCVFHICYDTGQLPRLSLYWTMVVAVFVMGLLTKHHTDLLLFVTIPIIALPILMYLCVARLTGLQYSEAVERILEKYEEMMKEPDIDLIPLDVPEDDDWDERI